MYISLCDLCSCFKRYMHAIGALAVGTLVLAVPLTVLANGLRENSNWQFQTTVDRAHKSAILDLIERKNAGMYTNTYNSTTHYNIADDYIDCNMTSQSFGNQGSVSQDAPVASPSIGVNPSTSSSSGGNSGTGSVTAGGVTSNTGLTSQNGDNGTVSNTSTAGGTNAVTTTQSNDGSTQSSTATGNTYSSTVSGVSGTGGGASVALNSTQSLSSSPVSSSISSSSACDFNTVSGSIGSPINSSGVSKK